jgi:hypothetical protein
MATLYTVSAFTGPLSGRYKNLEKVKQKLLSMPYGIPCEDLLASQEGLCSMVLESCKLCQRREQTVLAIKQS